MPRRKAEALEATEPPAPEPAASWRRLDGLKPWSRNPRRNDAAVPKVARSIIRYGWGRPIVCRAKDSEVVVGHTALRAALSLPELLAKAGTEKVPPRKDWHPEAIRTAEKGLAPVRAVELTQKDARRLALADNKLGEISEWDDELLLEELKLTPEEELVIAGWTKESVMKLELKGSPNEASLDESFGAVIEVSTEAEQVEIIEWAMGKGFKCRALS